MSNCTCGRTTRSPLCDGSHTLTDEQYQERTNRLAKLLPTQREIRINNLGNEEQYLEGSWVNRKIDN